MREILDRPPFYRHPPRRLRDCPELVSPPARPTDCPPPDCVCAAPAPVTRRGWLSRALSYARRLARAATTGIAPAPLPGPWFPPSAGFPLA